MLCVFFSRVKADPGGRAFDTPLYRRYRRALLAALRHRGLALAGMVGILALTIFALRFVPKMFFPENDRPLMVAELEFPFGTAIEHNMAVTQRIDEYIESKLRVQPGRPDGVTDWVTYVGEGGPRFRLGYTPEQPAPYVSAMLINATSRKAVVELAPALEAWCNETFPGLKATVRPLQNGPTTWPPIQVQIMGRDSDRIFGIVDQVKTKLRSIPGTRLIDDDWGAEAKKLVVRIDQARARRAGLTSRDIAISLGAYLSGLEATEFREGEELIPIVLRAAAHGRNALGDLESINVSSQGAGTVVPLKQVADVEPVWEAGIIRRRDRLHTVTVEAATERGVTAAEINAQLEPWLDEISQDWPFGSRWRFAGEHENSAEANAAIAAELPIAGLAIVLLLVLQFNSIRKPAIILLTIPFGLTGAVLGLLLAHSYFGFMTLLGVVSLSGIVINNAIVLIDRIQLERGEVGRTPQEAIVQAAQRRLRPILLTTATTVGGLIPLWLGGGPMFEPLAIVIIFGLLFSTFLTLGLVPTLYSVSYGVQFRGFEPGQQGTTNLRPDTDQGHPERGSEKAM
jgi:multidrug efflux pump subunit AcrB